MGIVGGFEFNTTLSQPLDFGKQPQTTTEKDQELSGYNI